MEFHFRSASNILKETKIADVFDAHQDDGVAIPIQGEFDAIFKFLGFHNAATTQHQRILANLEIDDDIDIRVGVAGRSREQEHVGPAAAIHPIVAIAADEHVATTSP